MGFKHWFQGFEMIGMFLVAVALPCFFIGLWGSKMINDLGNHPSKSAQIQASARMEDIFSGNNFFCIIESVCIYFYITSKTRERH